MLRRGTCLASEEQPTRRNPSLSMLGMDMPKARGRKGRMRTQLSRGLSYDRTKSGGEDESSGLGRGR